MKTVFQVTAVVAMTDGSTVALPGKTFDTEAEANGCMARMRGAANHSLTLRCVDPATGQDQFPLKLALQAFGVRGMSYGVRQVEVHGVDLVSLG